MKPRAPTQLRQLALTLPGDSQMSLPPRAEQELVEALAEILLAAAAGIAPAHEGNEVGDDDSE